jgi:sec-independent protein translocase protein TatA
MSPLFIILGVVGPTEIILILAIVLLLFGGKKLPELMKGLGSGIKEFKKASQGDYDKEEEKKPVAKDEKNTAEKN